MKMVISEVNFCIKEVVLGLGWKEIKNICLVEIILEMNSAQISELIGTSKEQVEEMLQTRDFENNG